MKQPEKTRILKELLRQVEQGVNVDAGMLLKNPTESYVCPDQAAREWQLFFREQPQLIGLSGDLPKPESYLTLDDFGVPILATRDGEGVFRAFLNACRHRGTTLVEETRGTAKRFTCPFHGWTYRANGQLHGITQAEDFGKIERSCLSLIELPAVERDGFLWVHPQPDGEIDLDAMLGGLAEELREWHVGDRVFSGATTLDKGMNWKLANDTFGETYHFARLHRNTLSNIFHSDALCYDAFGRNHRFVFPSKGIGSLRKKPESQWSTEGVTTILYYLFPNIQITIAERQIALFRIYPVPGHHGRSRTVVSHYFSAEALEHISAGTKTVIAANNVYDPSARDGNAVIAPQAAMEIVNSTLEKEDYMMGERTQRNIEAGLLPHLIFGRNEPALHHFHNTFRAELGMPALETLE
ncbi:MAG: phenylpropionate dioxygenase-like ring-hydroxylating dioxygenase large terminal subunit [Gammaproteobacteria bacterium]